MIWLKKFMELSGEEKGALIKSFALLNLAWLSLRLLSFERLLVFLEWYKPAQKKGLNPLILSELLAKIAWRLPKWKNCLVRSVATVILLRSYGHAAKLCVGVQRSSSEKSLGHAWVEDEQGSILYAQEEAQCFEEILQAESRVPPFNPSSE